MYKPPNIYQHTSISLSHSLQLQGYILYIPLLVWSHHPVCCSPSLQVGHVYHHHQHCLSFEKQKKKLKKKREPNDPFFSHSGVSIGVWTCGWGVGLQATSSEIKTLTFIFHSASSSAPGTTDFLIPYNSCTSSKKAVEEVIFLLEVIKISRCVVS